MDWSTCDVLKCGCVVSIVDQSVLRLCAACERISQFRVREDFLIENIDTSAKLINEIDQKISSDDNNGSDTVEQQQEVSVCIAVDVFLKQLQQSRKVWSRRKCLKRLLDPKYPYIKILAIKKIKNKWLCDIKKVQACDFKLVENFLSNRHKTM